jgi:hypothetical protein
MLLGALLVAHGLIRNETTVKWVAFVLGGFVLIAVVVSLVTSL